MKEKKTVDKDQELNESEVNNSGLNEESKPSPDSETEKKIKELESKVAELQDMFLRKAAEFENYKRRVENDQFNLLNYAAESFIKKLLPVVDDFERSLKHLPEVKDINSIKDGIRLMYDKLVKILSDQGIKKMESVGTPFNVNYHDALLQRDDPSLPPHTVIEEIQPGYFYKEKVIRHAQVIVSNDPTSDSPEITSENDNKSEESNSSE